MKLIHTTIISAALFGFLTSIASANARSPLLVEFYPMTHPVDDVDLPPAAINEYHMSQLGSMLYLKEQGIQKVFVEGNYQVLERQSFFEQADDFQTAQTTFLNDIFDSFPFNVSQMTEIQKLALRENRLGAYVLFRMGQIETLLPTQSANEYERGLELRNDELARAVGIKTGQITPRDSNEREWAHKLYAQITTAREISALQQIKAYAEQNPKVSRVSLIYGGWHNFLSHQKDFPELRIRKINVHKFRRTIASILSGDSLNQPLYDPLSFNQTTGQWELGSGFDF